MKKAIPVPADQGRILGAAGKVIPRPLESWRSRRIHRLPPIRRGRSDAVPPPIHAVRWQISPFAAWRLGWLRPPITLVMSFQPLTLPRGAGPGDPLPLANLSSEEIAIMSKAMKYAEKAAVY